MSEFKAIGQPSEGFYKEKGSKFLAFAYPVSSEEDVASVLEELKKKYYDARHHCYAYILGMELQRFRANDDGEPNHSAGDPILGQIRSLELTNTLVVVVRYFGGTKLGVGGLIKAYKTAAEDALAKAEIKTIYPTVKIQLSFGYEETSIVERILSEFEVNFLDREFTNECTFLMKIKKQNVQTLTEHFEKINCEYEVLT